MIKAAKGRPDRARILASWAERSKRCHRWPRRQSRSWAQWVWWVALFDQLCSTIVRGSCRGAIPVQARRMTGPRPPAGDEHGTQWMFVSGRPSTITSVSYVRAGQSQTGSPQPRPARLISCRSRPALGARTASDGQLGDEGATSWQRPDFAGDRRVVPTTKVPVGTATGFLRSPSDLPTASRFLSGPQ